MTETRTAITINGIVKEFSAGSQMIRVLHGIDAEIRSGELTYLVGESGSGKTTMISIIAGILYPTDGSVSVFGQDIYSLSDNDLVRFRLSNIGFIFQQYNLIPTLTAAENASVPLVAAGLKRDEAVERGREMLDKLNIADQAENCRGNCRAGSNKGSRSLARWSTNRDWWCVTNRPRRWMQNRAGESWTCCAKLPSPLNARVIIVTHDNRIFDLADRILVMEDGGITHDGKEMPDH